MNIVPSLAATPAEVAGLAEKLAGAAALRAEADDLEEEEDQRLAAIEAEYARWRGMLRALLPEGQAATWASEADVPAMLRAHLEQALGRVRAHELDALERARAELEQGRAKARLRGIAERFEALREALEAAVPGEPLLERAYQRVAAAHADAERARGALWELRENSALPIAADDPRLVEAWSTGTFDASELRALRDETTALEERVLRQRDELTRLGERLRHERPKRTRSSLDSEAAQLREKRADAMARHRKLTELSNALEELSLIHI